MSNFPDWWPKNPYKPGIIQHDVFIHTSQLILNAMPDYADRQELLAALSAKKTMTDFEVPKFFQRATGRKYSSKETCVNDMKRICATFWNEEMKRRLAVEKQPPGREAAH